MRRSIRLAGLLAAALALSACDDKHVKPSASASASASATESSADQTAEAPSASPSGSASAAVVDAGPPPAPARPVVKTFDAPEESKSPLPKVAEWVDTPRRAVIDRGKYDCSIQHVREWHRITCSCTNATVSLLAGTRDGVSIWATSEQAQLFFPVRRGDARAFEVMPHSHTVVVNNGGPYGPSAFEEEGGEPVVISETWLEGEDAPTIVVQ